MGTPYRALTAVWVMVAIMAPHMLFLKHAAALTITDETLSGQIAPTTNSLTHVFLFYNIGGSTNNDDVQAVALPDAPAGVVTPFEVTGPVMPDDQSQYTIVGVYDVVGSGVSVALNPASEADALGKTFGAVFGDFSESDIAGELQSGGQFFDMRTLFAGVLKGPSTGFPIVDFTSLGDPSTIIDFTSGTLNGSAFVQPGPIPEPTTIAMLVLLASACAARRMNYPVVAN